ncbi:helix-turn-helix domain-containing protein [Falsiroseomonas sp. E2-1-a4]|uniref:helix-turn-helix domain-containing protein n=1 Tax=Falsiroseomonas sp. E2-1-a4 TaxID=3239299 RepID=UPI003F359E93
MGSGRSAQSHATAPSTSIARTVEASLPAVALNAYRAPSTDHNGNRAASLMAGAAAVAQMAQGAAPRRRAIPAHEFRKIYGGISNTTFYELVNRGDISIHKIGRRTYVDADEAERWWRSCAQGER